MSRRSEYEKRTEELIRPILDRENFELVDVEFVQEAGTWYLRCFIDKDGGITINDCELVSREMNDLLDQKDFIRESYIFEVSSPGLDRPLKKDRDFERNLGKDVEIRTYKMINKTKEFRGTLKAYTPDTVTIEENGEEQVFNRKDIALIRQAIDF